MKKTFAMLFALAAVLAAGSACFTPSSKPDPDFPAVRTNPPPASVAPTVPR
jgi:hypothetical protein